ncbi:DUF4430 domain-containing protein [Candidatus Enterococcus courvalinii]|uniref:DUF4430 domain-containing protein n=1 Tax=Candidatus Enterococcus courvalinii TaxID=2815329 RepID=A0ABS3HXI3_9ENTE|nr:DUF4430 domain-containing protein [Enterococcus sp. MSG2901]MBO0481174.1 DUF4430 domain-containing protein [Enterococcus sp. MSG2901]
MKKIIYSLFVIVIGLGILGGCSSNIEKTSSSQLSSSVQQQEATIVLQEDGKEFANQKVDFETGENLLEVLQKTFKVEEEKGFITEIEGHKQNQTGQKYWLFTIDGESATKGAAEIELKPGQKIVFNLAKI